MVPPRLEIPADLEASIVLLRHGESTHIVEGRFQGQADSPLSALGERQAAAAAERLARPGPASPLGIPRPPLAIVHSPLLRAARTAELVADAFGRAGAGPTAGSPPPLRPEPRLMEIGQGRWEGMHRSAIEAEHGELLAAWRRTPLEVNAPGGERVADAAGRVQPALQYIIGELAAGAPAPWARSTAPASGYPAAHPATSPWTLLVAHDGILKVVLLTLLDLPLGRFWVFPFGLCGISIVELRDGRAVLRAHNLTDHLAAVSSRADGATAARAGRPADGAL
jgi:probable phosphoglycerate mutase